jgi:hypothetical protein
VKAQSVHFARRILILLGSVGALLLLAAQPAGAVTIGPALRVDSLANTTAAAGSSTWFDLQISNIGDAPVQASGADPIVFEISLPPQLSVEHFGTAGFFGATSEWSELGWSCSGDGPGAPPAVAGAHELSCEIPQGLGAHGVIKPLLRLHVDAGAVGGEVVSTRFTASGGDAPNVAAGAEATRIAPDVEFGIDAFDVETTDPTGHAYTQAGGHPDAFTTTVDYNTFTNTRIQEITGPYGQSGFPVGSSRDIVVKLPPGLAGNPASTPKCKLADLSTGEIQTNCPVGSQIGTIVLPFTFFTTNVIGPLPVVNMPAPPGSAAQIGFSAFGTVVTLKAHLRSSSDYGISIDAANIPEGLSIAGNSLTIWGTPAEERHDFERTCQAGYPPEYVGTRGDSCESTEPEVPFLRMPTSCGPLQWSAAMDSWENPGAMRTPAEAETSDPAWDSRSIEGHESPGYPLAPDDWGAAKGTEECSEVPFEPQVSALPTTHQADSPSGLSVDIEIPQEALLQPEAISQSDLRKAVVTLPEGMSINPAAAGGQQGCSPQQVGLSTPVGVAPVHFNESPAQCPNASKVGTVEIHSPLVDHPLQGAIYLAKQTDNPFKSLLALYQVFEDPSTGITIKLAGRVTANPVSGQLETVFDENPQLPFEALHFDLFGGPRAALRTPPRCGTYATHATLTPWSGNADVALSSPFAISEGPSGTPCPQGGFDPKLSAGTQSPLAATYSPFNLRISRDDGTQEIAGLSATLPPGLIGKPAGIPYCSDAALASVSAQLGTGAAQISAPSCPAASAVGTVTVGAGSGPNPFFATTGRAYLAGPYKGAPLSLAVITPAVAGPFDLGSVMVRNALRIDPESAQVSAISDPLPTILQGIPLDLRDIRVSLDRPNFTLNPTSCDPMAIDATIASTAGQSAQRSSRFQVAGCERLPFKPKLTLRLKGKTTRGAHPALTAVLTMPPAGANIARASVALPRSEFLDQAHIGTVCTRVQFAADQCPARSVYGHARATSPLVDYPVEGPVYLRSSNNKLPDLVMALHGPASQPVEVDAVARIDSVKGGIRSSFEAVPDLPLSKVVLQMQGGRKGLLQNSTNICAAAHRATALFDGQNGRVKDLSPALRADCAAAKHGKRGH